MQPWAGQRRLPEADALLLHAHAIYKAETCPRCGRHVKECHDPEKAHAWAIDEDLCYATAELERWRRDSAKHVAPGTAPVLMLSGEGGASSRQAELVAALARQG